MDKRSDLIADIKSPPSVSIRSIENIAVIRDSVIASPKKSVHRRQAYISQVSHILLLRKMCKCR